MRLQIRGFWTILDRVCVKITDGEHLSPPVLAGVPLPVRPKMFRDNHLDFSDTKFVTEEFAKGRARCNLNKEISWFVSRGCDHRKNLPSAGGRCFLPLMGPAVLLFKPDSRYVLPQMIEFCFKSASGLAALIATGSTAQQAITSRHEKRFALPVPPLPTGNGKSCGGWRTCLR